MQVVADEQEPWNVTVLSAVSAVPSTVLAWTLSLAPVADESTSSTAFTLPRTPLSFCGTTMPLRSTAGSPTITAAFGSVVTPVIVASWDALLERVQETFHLPTVRSHTALAAIERVEPVMMVWWGADALAGPMADTALSTAMATPAAAA